MRNNRPVLGEWAWIEFRYENLKLPELGRDGGEGWHGKTVSFVPVASWGMARGTITEKMGQVMRS